MEDFLTNIHWKISDYQINNKYYEPPFMVLVSESKLEQIKNMFIEKTTYCENKDEIMEKEVRIFGIIISSHPLIEDCDIKLVNN